MGSDADGEQGASEGGEEEDAAPRGRPERREFCLPNVKQLAKQFAAEEEVGAEGKNRGHWRPGEVAREAEVDYSTVPVSEIILALQQAAAPGAPTWRSHELCDRRRPPTLMAICRGGGADHVGEGGGGGGGGGGKEVHSLTARSISREFREGLKSGGWGREGGRSGTERGERERGDVVCSGGQLSPTPSVDLKHMKKFWEEIITANSNSTKQK